MPMQIMDSDDRKWRIFEDLDEAGLLIEERGDGEWRTVGHMSMADMKAISAIHATMVERRKTEADNGPAGVITGGKANEPGITKVCSEHPEKEVLPSSGPGLHTHDRGVGWTCEAPWSVKQETQPPSTTLDGERDV